MELSNRAIKRRQARENKQKERQNAFTAKEKQTDDKKKAVSILFI